MPYYSCKLNLFYYISQVTHTFSVLEKNSKPIDYLNHLVDFYSVAFAHVISPRGHYINLELAGQDLNVKPLTCLRVEKLYVPRP
jgi:hypothetical protein